VTPTGTRPARASIRQQSLVGQNRGVDAASEFADAVEGQSRLVLQLGERSVGQLGVAAQLVAGQPEPSDQRHDLLLHPVVDVPFQAAALDVLRLDDPGPGGGEFLGLVADLVKT
jgi:hypothetical protein